jgi:hypothetical protein
MRCFLFGFDFKEVYLKNVNKQVASKLKKRKKEEDFQTQFSTSSSGLIRSLDHFL